MSPSRSRIFLRPVGLSLSVAFTPNAMQNKRSNMKPVFVFMVAKLSIIIDTGKCSILFTMVKVCDDVLEI